MTYPENTPEVAVEATGSQEGLVRGPWVKPVLERLALKDALTGGRGASDGGNTHS